MAVANASMSAATSVQSESGLWLRSRNWDLMFITLSVIFVPLPYLIYLLFVKLGVNEDVSRNVVNGFVAIAIGGPHMMSTFLRTGFDKEFSQRYPMLIRSSIIIPIVVVSLAFLNLHLLLTIFFFWAATHVLHQVTYIVELYNHKEHKFVRKDKSAVTLQARLIDYAVIMTCLFPFAALKISQGSFDIGSNDLTSVIPDLFQHEWFFVLMSGAFFVAVAAFAVKSYREYRGGYINWPKTVFILLTVVVAFIMPALPNLDTAFQGLNTWHSFQYLALDLLHHQDSPDVRGDGQDRAAGRPLQQGQGLARFVRPQHDDAGRLGRRLHRRLHAGRHPQAGHRREHALRHRLLHVDPLVPVDSLLSRSFPVHELRGAGRSLRRRASQSQITDSQQKQGRSGKRIVPVLFLSLEAVV